MRCAATLLVFAWAALPACQTWSDDDSVGDELPAALLGIGVGPISSTLTLGDEVQFVATGFYSDQSRRDVTDTVTWTSSSPSVLQVGSGLDVEGRGLAMGLGQASVTAAFFELESNPVAVFVTEASVETLTVTPLSISLHVGEGTQLSAEAEFSDGTRGMVTGSVRWSTDDGLVATVDEAGKVEATGLGTVMLRATWETPSSSVEASPVAATVVAGDVNIDRADLRVVGMAAVAGADVVTYTVTIKNSGGSPASGFWVDVWLNRTAAPPPPPSTGDAYQFIDVLDAGAEVDVEIVVPDVTPGSYESWALVDSFASVSEGSLGENNNAYGPRETLVTGQGGPIGADLAVTYLQAFLQDDEVLYIVDVRNNGDEAAIDFVLGLFADAALPPTTPASGDEEIAIDVLLPGDTATFDLRIRDTPELWWQSYALVDTQGVLDEPNENNNLASISVEP